MNVEDKRGNCKKDAAEICNDNLMRMLEDNQNTVFGKKHHFSEIRDVDGYRQAVPLTNYEDFRGYIEDMLRGEENLLTVYPVVAFCHSSGTAGLAKDLPVTREALLRYSDYLEQHKNETMRTHGGKRLFINTLRTELDKEMKSPMLFSEIYYRFLWEQGQLHKEEYIGEDLLLFQKKSDNMFFAKVWAAMLTEDLVLIESIFLYDQLCFFHYMEQNWEKILWCIRNHTIMDEWKLPEKVEKWLLEMEVREERLNLIEEECKKGFAGIAGRLWPKLCLISGISNRAYFSEDAVLKKYTEDIPLHYFCYCASECYMATAWNNHDFSFRLQPECAFFEFIPYQEDDEETSAEKTFLANELNIGQQYEVVLTTYSGLYRYKMGDVVKVTGYQDGSPMLEVMFRKSIALNIAGEKVTVTQIEDVMAEVSKHYESIIEYCFGVCGENIPGNYLVYISMDEPQSENAEEIATLIDEVLSNENPDYKDLRELGRIGNVDVRILDRDAYMEFMKENGLMDGHNKPKHVSLKSFCKGKDRSCEKT